MSVSVLFVCTGNICRSPMAERVLLARARPGSVAAASAGTYGLVGHGMDAAAALVARELGADPDGHAARDLTVADLDAAQLVLTATVEHRELVLRLHPRALRRTFTLLEFARLGSGFVEPGDGSPAAAPPADDEQRLARIVEVGGRRGVVEAPGPGADDIGDPFGGPIEGMRRCGEEIARAVDDLIAILGFAPSG